MPLDDEALWLCARYAEETGAIVIGPVGEQARFAIDKRLQFARARAAGFHVPETLEFDSLDELSRYEDGLPFPVIVKRATAADAADTKLAHVPTTICADASELERLLSSSHGAQPILVQPWIRGVGEGIFGLMSRGRLVTVSAHRRIRMVDPHGSGSSACVSIPPDPKLVASTEQMLADVGWRGLFMVELLQGDGATWFTEFNGRAWGSMALARRIGFEYPAWAARERLFGDAAVVAPIGYPQIRCRHLGFEIAHLLAVMKGPRSRAITFPSRAQTIRDIARIRRSDTWYNLRHGCRRVFVDDTIQTALAPVRHRAQRWASHRRP
jgi:predicted ATP-grasp superfamily ATP-dependent carboligase